MYTDCVEGIINALPGVNRSALIGIGSPPHQEPAIVVELEDGRSLGAGEVLGHAARHPVTRSIRRVIFKRNFPVDVRHNAKIHRLRLAREFAG